MRDWQRFEVIRQHMLAMANDYVKALSLYGGAEIKEMDEPAKEKFARAGSQERINI